MVDRDAFLATVRDRIGAGLPTNLLRPLHPTAGSTPEITYTPDLTDHLAAFTTAATAAGAEVHRLDDLDAVRDLLARLRDEDGVATAVVSHDPEVEAVPDVLAELGIEPVTVGDADAAAAADLGVTGAAFGIALTGSVVVDSRRAGTRLASLLPPTHVVLLDRSRLLPTPGALLRHLDRHLPDGLPSNLVFVTGHSRSADIELRLTPGVHGPRRVVIGLVGA